MVAVGEEAPDFQLPGTDGTDAGHRIYSLSEYRGQPVVLVFYPGDNTPVCTVQLNSYAAALDDFRSLGVQVLALSPQDVQSHDEFSESQGGFGFPLLADVGKEVGRLYNIVGPLGFYRRSIYVVGRDGRVGYSHRAVSGLGYRSTEELLAAVNGLP